MIAYDTTVDPPAPYLGVTIANSLQQRRREQLSALLDTGSDVTAIPATLVDPLQLYPIGRLQLEDVKSDTSFVYTYAVRLTVATIVIPRLEVILTGLDFIVLGRDVLNDFYIHLDGPKQLFDLSTSQFISP